MLVPIDMIESGQRLRGVSEATVEALVNSIADVGLLSPITVYPRSLYRSGAKVDGYGLVAGLHRLTACQRLGLVEIEANVVELSDLERQIAECDENLCGPQLTPADRARFTRRRKEAYEALHPETRHGTNQHTRGDAEFASPNFAADQAAKTGVSERLVQLNAERGEKVTPEALELIRGTDLDTGRFLDTLKSISRDEQVKTVREQLRSMRDKPRKVVRIADDPLDDDDARERQIAALMSAWNKASAEARAEFLDRIDAPIMDRSAA